MVRVGVEPNPSPTPNLDPNPNLDPDPNTNLNPYPNQARERLLGPESEAGSSGGGGGSGGGRPIARLTPGEIIQQASAYYGYTHYGCTCYGYAYHGHSYYGYTYYGETVCSVRARYVWVLYDLPVIV